MIPTPDHSPLPLITERLRWVLEAGVLVGTVIYVGVQGGTDFLLDCCSSQKHLLFEPVDAYFDAIGRRYATVQHELIRVAASDEDGSAWQLGYSRDGSGAITHSQISFEEMAVGSEPALVSCKPVQRSRLDTALRGRQDDQPYLLKIDVDGHEIPILHGATQTLRQCSLVIVEASVRSIGPKIALLEANGFDLLDIVDPCYYHGMLSQVDLMFVSKAWVAKCPDLRPWQTKPFAWEAWSALARDARLSR